MITHADVKCYNCDNTFPIYWHNWEKQLPISCPYCVAKFTERAEEMLKNALGAAADLNKELRSDHMDGTNPDLFQVNFKHVYVPLEKYRLDD
ncbi:hypothetical protein [Lysinibacillus sp. NPDC096212]|uniref:hypothetical protein n=1 Tax=Lysinibacillus sp. NPDC096212 TaxID=3364135 RepID=UPI003819D82D